MEAVLMKVIVCKELVDGLRAIALYRRDESAVIETPDRFEVSLSSLVVHVTHAAKMEGKSFDDVLLRLMSLAKAKGKPN
jgi:hypothetical protein